MSVAVAELHEIVISHRGQKILGPVSLTIEKGDFWGIIGPNGAGKSTLLRTLAGQQQVTGGNLSLFGYPPAGGTSKKIPSAVLKQAGVLLQRHDFYPDIPFAVEDVILFGRVGFPGIGRRYSSSDRKALERSLSIMGMTEFRHRLYRELSGGEQRKVHLARLVAQEPELLLLDEPTAGLDIDWQERLTDLVDDMYRRIGKTIVMVTHDIDRLPACCNNVLLLKNGTVLALGAPENVFTKDMLSQLYGCEIEVTVRSGRYHAYSDGVLSKNS